MTTTPELDHAPPWAESPWRGVIALLDAGNMAAATAAASRTSQLCSDAGRALAEAGQIPHFGCALYFVSRDPLAATALARLRPYLDKKTPAHLTTRPRLPWRSAHLTPSLPWRLTLSRRSVARLTLMARSVARSTLMAMTFSRN